MVIMSSIKRLETPVHRTGREFLLSIEEEEEEGEEEERRVTRLAYDLIDASPAKYTEGNGNRVSCPEVSSATIILSYDPWIERCAISYRSIQTCPPPLPSSA